MSHTETRPVRPPKTVQQIMQEEIERLQRQLREIERGAANRAAEEAKKRNNDLKQATRNIMNQVKDINRKTEQVFRDALAKAQEQNIKQNAQLRQQIQQRINQLGEQTRQQLDQLDRQHRQQMQKLSDNIYDSMDKMQQQLAGQINTVANSVTQLADQVGKRFQGIDNQLEIQSHNQQVLAEQQQALAAGMAQMAQDVDKRFQHTDQQIEALQGDIKDIYQHFADEDRNAQEAVNAAVALLDAVEKRTLIDRFAPNYEAQNIRMQIQQLLNSPHHGATLAAMAEAAILAIMQTESHAIQEQAKHNALVEAVLQQADRVLTVVNDNRVIKEEVKDGEPMEIENDFWSKGEYSQLEAKLKDLQAELNDRYSPTLNRVRIDTILKEISQIETRILQICNESVAKSVLSEARVEAVEDIVNAMMGHGWKLKGGIEHPDLDYLGGDVPNDWREGVFAILEKNTGETITVIVDPDDNGKNQLIVHQEGNGNAETAAELAEKMTIICDELAEAGYDIPQGSQKQGYTHLPQMASGKQLGAAKAAEEIRSKIH